MNGRLPMGNRPRERGTALVIAMLLLVILTALGLYAVSITSSELEMANYTRAGGYYGIDTLPVMTTATGLTLANGSTYNVATTSVGAEAIPGYDTGWVRVVFNVRSTGRPPGAFTGQRIIDAGAAYGPVPSGTGY